MRNVFIDFAFWLSSTYVSKFRLQNDLLWLAMNKIDVVGAQEIAAALEINTTLKELNLG